MKRVAALIILTGILVGGTVFALRLTNIPKVQGPKLLLECQL
jgi:hypothetical protein